jgi:hypothetical protein
MNWWVVFRNALAKPVKLSKMPVKEASSAAVNRLPTMRIKSSRLKGVFA